jgi:hypothetical protein
MDLFRKTALDSNIFFSPSSPDLRAGQKSKGVFPNLKFWVSKLL